MYRLLRLLRSSTLGAWRCGCDGCGNSAAVKVGPVVMAWRRSARTGWWSTVASRVQSSSRSSSVNWPVQRWGQIASRGEDLCRARRRRHPVDSIGLLGRYQGQHRRRHGLSRRCRVGRCVTGLSGGLPQEAHGCRGQLLVVGHAGFEPAISDLRGRCPGPLDECPMRRWPLLMRPVRPAPEMGVISVQASLYLGSVADRPLPAAATPR